MKYVGSFMLALWCVPTLVVLAQTSAPRNGNVPLDGTLDQVRTRIIQLVESGDVPSMAVAVARDGEIIWEEAFGWADRDRRVEATPSTIYAIGSLSKSITATGVMRLVEQGKVGLDDPVETILGPGALRLYSGRAVDVTVHRLLQMTAGIPHGWATFPGIPTTAERADYQDRSGIVVFSPGSTYEYSNNSYGVLGRIIEHASGKSLADYMRSEVFDPLGMAHASVGSNPDLRDQTAVLYEEDGSVQPPYTFEPLGGGGYYASVRDLIRFGLFHLGEPGVESILRPETLHRMHTDRDTSIANALMSLGWGGGMLDDSILWLISNGSIRGGNAHLTLVPSERVVVACLVNSTSNASVADQIAFEIADAVIPGFGDKINRAIEQYMADNNRPYEQDPRLTGRWTGTIRTKETTLPVTLNFTPDGTASVQVGGGDASPLESLAWEAGLLRARFNTTASIYPAIGDGIPGQVDVRLGQNEGDLSGYVSVYVSDDRASYALPAYMALSREMD